MGQNDEVKGKLKLWYKRQAEQWEEALPIGNGRMGGMVFGGTTLEQIQLNEDTLWSGYPRDTNNYEALRYLAPARALIDAGKYAEGQQLIDANMLGRNTESYLPMGHLYIEQLNVANSVDYMRELQLDTGIVLTKYRVGQTIYTRETWISAPDQVMVVHLTAEGDGSIDLSAMLSSPLKHEVRELCGNRIALYGVTPSHIADNYHNDHPQSILYEEGLGMRFELHLQVITGGGSFSIVDGNKLQIKQAKTVTLLLATATQYEGFDINPAMSTKQLSALCTTDLEAAAALGYELLRDRHVKDVQSLFGRVDLHLGKSSTSIESLSTDERLERYKEQGTDPELEVLLFQYGRYLMVAGSRPGTQPLNLQGIWNHHIQPPWNSNYTTNINTEMNYWPVEVCNLSECHEPLLQMIEELSVTGARTARIHYQCEGWTAHHNVDLWRSSVPSSGEASWAMWPMGGAWLSRHLWEHFVYQPDLVYLRETAYPIMRGAALFCLDFLVENPDGMLVTNPSTSPENKFVTTAGDVCSVSIASTMDMSIIRDLFGHCIEAATMMGIDESLREKLRDAYGRLVPLTVGIDGRIREWSTDFEEKEPGHRHVSHLYGLYPGHEMNWDRTPELMEASSQSLKYRIEQGGGHTGWSCAWLINLYARLGNAESAYSYVRTMLSRSTHPNLFGDHPPFQIDANFGSSAGIAEMLLQSHDGIELLPALPKAWSKGYVRGLKARGGFSVDMQWEDHTLRFAVITSTHGGACHIRYKGANLMIQLEDGAILNGRDCYQSNVGDVFIVRVEV